MLEAAKDAGAVAAGYVVAAPAAARSAPLFREWLASALPRPRRQGHGAGPRDARRQGLRPEWGNRMKGEGLWADLIARRFKIAVARLGLDGLQPPFRTDFFKPPPKTGDQLALF